MMNPFARSPEIEVEPEIEVDADILTAEEQTKALLESADIGGNAHALDTFFRINGDGSNEERIAMAKEMTDAVGGGKATSINEAMGGMMDDNTAARYGSLSSNTSSAARMEQKQWELKTPEELAMQDENMPVIGNSPEVAIQAIYEYLTQMKFDEDELNRSLAEGGVDNNRATLNSLYDMVSGIPFIGEYIQTLDFGLMSDELQNGEEADPVVGTAPEPEALEQQAAEAQLANELDQSNDPNMNPFQGGPSAPSGPR